MRPGSLRLYPDLEVAKAQAVTQADAFRAFADALRKIPMPAALEDDQ